MLVNTSLTFHFNCDGRRFRQAVLWVQGGTLEVHAALQTVWGQEEHAPFNRAVLQHPDIGALWGAGGQAGEVSSDPSRHRVEIADGNTRVVV